jgi:hypothetical protein
VYGANWKWNVLRAFYSAIRPCQPPFMIVVPSFFGALRDGFSKSVGKRSTARTEAEMSATRDHSARANDGDRFADLSNSRSGRKYPKRLWAVCQLHALYLARRFCRRLEMSNLVVQDTGRASRTVVFDGWGYSSCSKQGERTRPLDNVNHGRDRHRTRRQIVPADPEDLESYRQIALATGL